MLFALFLPIIFWGTTFASVGQDTADMDQDYIPDVMDRCPQIPYAHSTNGCPVFVSRRVVQSPQPVKIQWVYTAPTLRIREKTEIRAGDTFRAVVLDAQGKKVLKQSSAFTVVGD